MSALEYTIHHYTEIHKKLRNAKGQVLLQNEHGGVTPAAAPAAAVPSTKTGAVPGGHHSLVLNGFHGSLATAAVSDAVDAPNKRPAPAPSSPTIAALTSGGGCTTTTTPSSTATRTCGADSAVAAASPQPEDGAAASVTSGVDDASESAGEESCSRACPLLRSKFRRRNLIRLDSWYGPTTSNGGRQFASVRCDCVAPVTCVLCVRRGPGADLSSQHVYANLLPVQSKIALLEPTYHPVLSFSSGE